MLPTLGTVTSEGLKGFAVADPFVCRYRPAARRDRLLDGKLHEPGHARIARPWSTPTPPYSVKKGLGFISLQRECVAKVFLSLDLATESS
jgi:hypothetical protein